jgi:membrane protease YdiL (CAAX protease family)
MKKLNMYAIFYLLKKGYYMQETIQVIINAFTQLALFSAIPFLCWLVFYRKKEKFFSWIGFKKPVIKSKHVFVLLSSLFLLVSIISNFLPTIVERSQTATGQLQGVGLAILIQSLVFGFIQTGASEEILFRGFLAKRFIKFFGFSFGNLLQSALFGLIHVLLAFLVFSSIDIRQGLLLFIIPCIAGWLFGYINEKQSGGSIVPSWLLHSIGNVIAAIIAMSI